MAKPGKTIKQSDTCKGKVYMYDNGIMHQVYHDAIHIDIEDSMKEMEIYRNEFCTQGARPILVDITNVKSVCKESRGIYSSQDTALIFSKAALLVGNPVSRIIGNFYLGLNKSAMPVQMFTVAEEAMDWLEQNDMEE